MEKIFQCCTAMYQHLFISNKDLEFEILELFEKNKCFKSVLIVCFQYGNLFVCLFLLPYQYILLFLWHYQSNLKEIKSINIE